MGTEVPLVRQKPFIQGRRMKHRDATLQAFYDLTETAILRRAEFDFLANRPAGIEL